MLAVRRCCQVFLRIGIVHLERTYVWTSVYVCLMHASLIWTAFRSPRGTKIGSCTLIWRLFASSFAVARSVCYLFCAVSLGRNVRTAHSILQGHETIGPIVFQSHSIRRKQNNGAKMVATVVAPLLTKAAHGQIWYAHLGHLEASHSDGASTLLDSNHLS